MNEAELYKELGKLTKDKEKWEENIPYVASLLNHESIMIRAKALWLLGEMGLIYPSEIIDYIPAIANLLENKEPLLRERAINALGRIGRANFNSIKPYWKDMFRYALDEDPNVRLNFIWASENIATNTPEPYEDKMPIFEKMLYDENDKVRMEAPEIFRVLGKRKPEYVKPFIEKLRTISESDSNRVVRIHSLGAIKTAKLN